MLVAPLLVLAGVAAAFLPMFDPGYQLAVAAPFSGFTLLLVRAVCALVAALVPVVAAALLLPGPGWLPAGAAAAVAGAVRVRARGRDRLTAALAALTAAAVCGRCRCCSWRPRPLRIVQPNAQIACAPYCAPRRSAAGAT